MNFADLEQVCSEHIEKNLLKQLLPLSCFLIYNNYSLPFLISSTTPGSSNVVVSPRFLVSPSAIFLNILRMIFPLLVFGSPVTNWILSGFAMAPITLLQFEDIFSCQFLSP